MSDVKLCNNHGGMFATDDDGWGKFSGEIHHLVGNDWGGEAEFTEHVTWHFCGNCLKDMRKAGKVNRRQQYIAELERENHIPPIEGTGTQ